MDLDKNIIIGEEVFFWQFFVTVLFYTWLALASLSGY
jgi:hypothetical protein